MPTRRSVSGDTVYDVFLGPNAGPAGIALRGWPPHAVFVQEIKPNAPVAVLEACIAAGDALVAVNGIDVFNVSSEDMAAALRS